MVAKINIRKQPVWCVGIQSGEGGRGLGKILGSNLVFEPADGQINVAECMNDFMQFVPAHFRTEKPVFSCIHSIHILMTA